MRGPVHADGWLKVPYDGHDLSQVLIALTRKSEPDEGEWRPAFLDWHDDGRGRHRVAQARLSGSGQVWLSIDGRTEKIGTVRS